MLKNFSRHETEEKEKTYKNKSKTIKKMVIGTYISIITLNVNGLGTFLVAQWLRICLPMQGTRV